MEKEAVLWCAAGSGFVHGAAHPVEQHGQDDPGQKQSQRHQKDEQQHPEQLQCKPGDCDGEQDFEHANFLDAWWSENSKNPLRQGVSV